MGLTKDELGTLIREGIVSDIFAAERAYALLKGIGEHAAAINASKLNFGELFGAIQDLARSEAVLAVARLFDPPSRAYPTRSVRTLLETLLKNADALPPIIDKPLMVNELINAGMEPADVTLIKDVDDSTASRALVSFFQSRLDAVEIAAGIKLLKNVRDKRIAHNEAIDDLTGPTWNAVLELLALAKQVVGIVGWGYLSTDYLHDGHYALSWDAERPSLALHRMLEELGIIERSRPLQPPAS